MPQEKTEFRNTTDHIIGVITIEPGGRHVPLPLVGGATVWLTEDEQIATANAPKANEDNPFINGDLERVGAPENRRNRRPIGIPQEQESDSEKQQREEARVAKAKRDKEVADQVSEEEARRKQGQDEAHKAGTPRQQPRRQSPEETGAPPQPQGKAAEGSRAAGEEVGTPEAATAS